MRTCIVLLAAILALGVTDVADVHGQRRIDPVDSCMQRKVALDRREASLVERESEVADRERSVAQREARMNRKEREEKQMLERLRRELSPIATELQ